MKGKYVAATVLGFAMLLAAAVFAFFLFFEDARNFFENLRSFFVDASDNPLIRDYAFPAIIDEVDSLIEQGKDREALSLLKGARIKAVSETEWLSLAKREIALFDFAAAEKSLKQGLNAFPASEKLSAVIVYVLFHQGKAKRASKFISSIAETEFAPFAVYAEIISSKGISPRSGQDAKVSRIAKKSSLSFQAPPSLCMEAWRFTGNPVFRRSAALFYAITGDYGKAASLFNVLPEKGNLARVAYPDDRLFRAILAYDSYNFSAVPSLLALRDFSNINSHTTEEAMLAADALYLSENKGNAATIWRSLFESGAKNPIVFLNASLTASSLAEKIEPLAKCLEMFPAYHPALSIYVRSASEASFRQDVFPFYGTDFSRRALEETSLVSENMQQNYFDKPVSIADAENALNAAREAASDDDALSLQIGLESIRFLCFQAGKVSQARYNMWNILERYSEEDLVKEFALWFFAKQLDFDTFFKLAKSFAKVNPVYEGIADAADGNFSRALSNFRKDLGESYKLAATANAALILKNRMNYDRSAHYFMLASDLTNDEIIKSKLYYNVAVVYNLQKEQVRAKEMLNHALALDPNNYSAKALLKRID